MSEETLQLLRLISQITGVLALISLSFWIYFKLKRIFYFRCKKCGYEHHTNVETKKGICKKCYGN